MKSMPNRWPVGGEHVVEALSEPDGLGRMHYVTWWWASALWDDDGRDCSDAPRSSLRAQHFFGVPDALASARD